MTSDRYRARLLTAQWSWREEKVCPYHGPSVHKDRSSGRADKRAARQQDRAETLDRAAGIQDTYADRRDEY